MPIATVQLLAGAFTREQKAQLLEDIADAFVRMGGDEAFRSRVHLTINEVQDGDWLVGGELLTLEAVERRRAARRAQSREDGA